MNKTAKLFVCAVGIFSTYFYYGLIQEKITRSKYGDDNFTCVLSLIFTQCLVNYIFAKVILATVMKQGEDATNPIYYVSSAITYLLAMLCSTMALQWVNYPTQVIGKSGKPIPVMILGVLLGGKSYPFRKYCFVLLVVIGVAVFMYKDTPSSSNESSSIFGFGEFLIMLSLVLDGLTGAIQERMLHEHQSKSGHMMAQMNKWTVILVGILVIFTGEYPIFMSFVQKHPRIVMELISFSLASAVGQFFIFLTVSEFGPLPCSIITTTRKFFSVLGSVLFFGHVLLPRQWFATAMVFTGLFLDSFYGKTSKPSQKK